MSRKIKLIIVFILCVVFTCFSLGAKNNNTTDLIKWVDLNVSYEVLNEAYKLDKKYHGQNINNIPVNFIELLSYVAIKNGNDFSNPIKDKKSIYNLINIMQTEGKSATDIYGENKYYNYYLKSYSAVFNQFIGEYYIEEELQNIQEEKLQNNDLESLPQFNTEPEKEKPQIKTQYGLTVYSPIAKGYYYADYDDFGNTRSYGFKRKHLGHDMMGSVGTPIIAIEGGTVTELGWNKYGGWRIGIGSFDGQRYYYYAHLRKNAPFRDGLKLGDVINAGEVIGYLGNTGYSNKENTNMTTGKPHLHLGLQLIFDESQRDGNNEIWVDMYAVTKFLAANKAQIRRKEGSKEFESYNLRKRVDLLQVR